VHALYCSQQKDVIPKQYLKEREAGDQTRIPDLGRHLGNLRHRLGVSRHRRRWIVGMGAGCPVTWSDGVEIDGIRQAEAGI